MSKNESSNDTEAGKDVVAADTEDAVQFDRGADAPVDKDESPAPPNDDTDAVAVKIDAADAAPAGTDAAASTESAETAAAADTAEKAAEAETSAAAPAAAKPDAAAPPPAPKPRRSWFGLFNFLLILALAGAAGYYWWLEQQVKQQYEATIADLRASLRAEIATRASNSSLAAFDGEIDSLRGNLEVMQSELGKLGAGQENLQAASEKLYELYGRDKNDWQLAEVEYLMRVAQHRLILQDDFEGAALTLQAASDKIALTADPGLLPVRVLISEEIADLKTRKRPDLVGMTLILKQLARQVRVLDAGFARRVDDTPASAPPAAEEAGDLLERFNRVVDSLVTIRYQDERKPSEVEASVANIGDTIEDNLKLARWAVLDRDAFQYRQLIDETARLFREFYDLDNAANGDFLDQLQDLQKMQLKPEKPDITGSLRELQRILSQRENAPEEAPAPVEPAAVESSDG